MSSFYSFLAPFPPVTPGGPESESESESELELETELGSELELEERLLLSFYHQGGVDPSLGSPFAV